MVPFHQNFLNLEHVVFDDDESIALFQVEFRFPDIDMCPTSIVAKTFLFQALLLRATECAKYGLLHSGKILETSERRILMNKLSNNDGNRATSDTSQLTDEDLEELTRGSHAMLDFLRPVFHRLENPAEYILRQLADKPNSLRQAEGKNWPDIETELGGLADASAAQPDSVDDKLIRLIELTELSKLKDENSWRNYAADALWIMREDVDQRLGRLAWRQPVWDSGLGSYIFRK